MRTVYKNDAYHDLFVFDALDTIAGFISIEDNDPIAFVATLNGAVMYIVFDKSLDRDRGLVTDLSVVDTFVGTVATFC